MISENHRITCSANRREVADIGPILVTGAAGQLGAVGRTVTGLLLDFEWIALRTQDDLNLSSLQLLPDLPFC
jgi:hypothetical protein